MEKSGDLRGHLDVQQEEGETATQVAWLSRYGLLANAPKYPSYRVQAETLCAGHTNGHKGVRFLWCLEKTAQVAWLQHFSSRSLLGRPEARILNCTAHPSSSTRYGHDLRAVMGVGLMAPCSCICVQFTVCAARSNKTPLSWSQLC
jgi:hypothetical protein